MKFYKISFCLLLESNLMEYVISLLYRVINVHENCVTVAYNIFYYCLV